MLMLISDITNYQAYYHLSIQSIIYHSYKIINHLIIHVYLLFIY